MRAFLIVIASLLLGACVQTRVASYVDPAYRGGAKIGSMVVAADTQQLGEREALETAAVAALKDRGVRAVRMIDLVPPTRPAGPSAEAAALRAAGTQAVLRIALERRGVATRYVPPPPFWGDPFFPYYGYGYGSYPGAFFGPVPAGSWVEEPMARYAATLQDTARGATIWKGEAAARGGSDFSDIASKVARDLVARLGEDGLI